MKFVIAERLFMMTSTKSSNTIQSLEIGCDILELVASSEHPLKFNEIQERSGMTKSNLHKYLNTLTQAGMLYRDKSSNLYTLGSKLIRYGMKALNQENAMDKVMPFLQEINRECRNTVLLTSWSPNGPMVVSMINSQVGLNIGAQIGTVVPPMSAAGKVFIAFQNEPEVEEWKQREWTKLDENKRRMLEKEIEGVREQGIAFAKEPLVPSISSIALPVFKYDDRLLGVIVVVGFSQSIPDRIEDELGRYLLGMRDRIAEAFGAEKFRHRLRQ